MAMRRDTAAETETIPTGATRLRAVARAPAHRSRVLTVLGPGRAAWLGEPLDPQPSLADGATRYAVDLEMAIGSGGTQVSLRKAAFVDVGPLVESPAPHRSPRVWISWRASTLAPLFPVFAGTLSWSAGALILDGWYAPPGGAVGQAADRVMFRTVARRTARWLLNRIVSEMLVPPPA